MRKLNMRYAMERRKATMVAGALMLLTGCAAWNEPARVEKDFGHSVRLMIAEQIYDPKAAQYPTADVPVHDGAAADAAVSGYGIAATEARVERREQVGSPLPIVGIISGPEE